MKKVLALLLALAMVFSFAACGSDKKGGEQEIKKVSDWKDYDLEAGTIVVYSTINENDMKMTEDVWYSAYPDVNIEWVSGGIGVIMTRLESEGGESGADIVYGGLSQTDGTKYHDLLQPYTSIYNDEARLKDEYGYYGFYSVQVETLVVNTKLCKEMGIEVKGYEDLLQPQLKGKIIQADPAASSSAWRQLQTMLMVYGGLEADAAWDYVDKLCANTNGFLSGSSSKVYKDVVSGEYAVGISYETSCLQLLQDGAEDIEVVYMEEGNTMAGFAVAMLKDAPNKAAACAFYDMIMSAEYQDISAEQTLTRGVNSKMTYQVPGMLSYDDLGLIDMNFTELIEKTDWILDKFSTINNKYM